MSARKKAGPLKGFIRISMGKVAADLAVKAIAAIASMYIAWMIWVTGSLYSQREDLAIIKHTMEQVYQTSAFPLRGGLCAKSSDTDRLHQSESDTASPDGSDPKL